MIFIIALIKIALHLAVIKDYGVFIDELYYLACASHLDWGYVDHPPLIALITAFEREFFGDSLLALRILPVLAGGVTVILAGLCAEEMGGKRFAGIIAGLAVAIAPLFFILNHILTMNAFDVLFWTLGAYLLIRLLKNDSIPTWIGWGLVIGLGMMNKISMGFFAGGIFVGLLLTKERKRLAGKGFWISAGTAFVIFLPYILWQIPHNFPTWEFMRNASLYKNMPTAITAFLSEMVLEMNPINLPILLLGLYFLFFTKAGKQYRLLGWMFVFVFILLRLSNAKVYYIAPVYPILFSVGAVQIETLLKRANWFKFAIIPLMSICGLVLMPMTLPILPVEKYIAYRQKLGLQTQQMERDAEAELPQYFADMFGWGNLTMEVAKVYNRLSLEERAKCAIFCETYGQAGAIDYFGPKYGLPKAMSNQNSYWLWGPIPCTGEIIICVGSDEEDVAPNYASIQLAGIAHHQYAMPRSQNVPIWICRGLKLPVKEAWKGIRKYI